MIGAAALLCLTQAVYFESRNQPLAGQYAVAEVVMNRVKSSKFPNDVCSVTNQDLGPKSYDCQFSYACDGIPETMHNKKARDKAEKVAREAGSGRGVLTKGALYFHAHNVRPSWARKFTRTLSVGTQSFYKP